jgi:hypothetical protein
MLSIFSALGWAHIHGMTCKDPNRVGTCKDPSAVGDLWIPQLLYKDIGSEKAPYLSKTDESERCTTVSCVVSGLCTLTRQCCCKVTQRLWVHIVLTNTLVATMPAADVSAAGTQGTQKVHGGLTALNSFAASPPKLSAV